MVFKKVTLFLLCSLLLVGCSVRTSTIQKQQIRQVELTQKDKIPTSFIPQDLHIVAFGDSLTEGVGDSSNNGGYTSILKEQLASRDEFRKVTISNLGVKGNKTTELLNRLEKETIRTEISRADMVIITVGGNDMMKVVKENLFSISLKVFEEEQSTYKENLHALLKEVRELNPESPILLVGLYNPFADLVALITELEKVFNGWNETSKTVLNEFDNTVFVPVDDLFANSTEDLLSSDEFHPNTSGYKLIGERIYKMLPFDGLVH